MAVVVYWVYERVELKQRNVRRIDVTVLGMNSFPWYLDVDFLK